MKKLLTILMVMTGFCLSFAMAEDSDAVPRPETHIYGDYEYIILEDGTAEITCYTSSAESLTIPSEINGIPVTGIGNKAFTHCWLLNSVTIPDSVIHVGANPFADCDLESINVSPDHPYLTTIDGVLFSKPDHRLICYPALFMADSYIIPQGTCEIGDEAFYYNEFLASVTIPDSVTRVGDGAFYRCESLTGITIPDSVNSIGERVFDRCSSLTSISIPNSITAIGDYAFRECSALASVSIPDSVIRIGNGAFDSCFSLTGIVIPDSVTDIGNEAFGACSSLTGITIPDSVTSIGDEAFYCCFSLTEITIPDSVISIGVNPFLRCDKLISIIVSPDHPYLQTMDGVLFSKQDHRLVCYPNALPAESYAIPRGVQIIGERAFFYCESLLSITIPDSVTVIGNEAFELCRSLTSVTIPDSVVHIGEYAFPLSDLSESFVATVTRDSYAADYCLKKNIPYTYCDALTD